MFERDRRWLTVLTKAQTPNFEILVFASPNLKAIFLHFSLHVREKLHKSSSSPARSRQRCRLFLNHARLTIPFHSTGSTASSSNRREFPPCLENRYIRHP